MQEAAAAAVVAGIGAGLGPAVAGVGGVQSLVARILLGLVGVLVGVLVRQPVHYYSYRHYHLYATPMCFSSSCFCH